MATWLQIINEAFQDLGIIVTGETITADMQANAFLQLQQMIANASAEEVIADKQFHQSFNLTAGTAVYTVGTAGTLVSTARPLRIISWQSVHSSGVRNSGRAISFADFAQNVPNPLAATSVLVGTLAADNAFPSINIRVDPVPAASPASLILDYWGAFTAPVLVTDAVTLPPEFEEFLHFNLALRLSPQYQPNISESLAAMASNAKGVLATLNASIMGLTAAPAAKG